MEKNNLKFFHSLIYTFIYISVYIGEGEVVSCKHYFQKYTFFRRKIINYLAITLYYYQIVKTQKKLTQHS